MTNKDLMRRCQQFAAVENSPAWLAWLRDQNSLFGYNPAVPPQFSPAGPDYVRFVWETREKLLHTVGAKGYQILDLLFFKQWLPARVARFLGRNIIGVYFARWCFALLLKRRLAHLPEMP